MQHKWKKDDDIIALWLYKKLYEIGKAKVNNPHIREAAEAIGTSSESLVMRLHNFASINQKGKGLRNAAELSRKVNDEFFHAKSRLQSAAEIAAKNIGYKLPDL